MGPCGDACHGSKLPSCSETLGGLILIPLPDGGLQVVRLLLPHKALQAWPAAPAQLQLHYRGFCLIGAQHQSNVLAAP